MELVIVTADPNLWKVSNPEIIKYANPIKAPKLVKLYYEKLIPMTYRTGFLGIFTPFKILSLFITGIFRPITRRLDLVERSAGNCHKISGFSGAENFVLALEAEGFSSCMMEGHDERRVLNLLGLKHPARTAMVIGIGEPSERALWGGSLGYR